MRDKRIGVLMGGLSAEREVSLATGEAVHHALGERGFQVERLFADRDLDLMLRQSRIDVAFIALHGRYGEDGCVQGLLELLGIPYTGSGVCASALAMNKVKAKEIFRLHNLPTPSYYTLVRGARGGDGSLIDEELATSFGFPCVVKPASEGSSVGISVARDLTELEAALEEAHRFDDEVLVERFIAGREISVAVLGDRAIGAIEVAPRRDLYDYAAKYTSGRAEYYSPVRLSPERQRGVLTQAVAAHRALGCEGLSRVDLLVSDLGNEYLLEVNSLPALGPGSLLPKIVHAAGLDLGELCERILAGASLKAHGLKGIDRGTSELPIPGLDPRTAGSIDPN